MRCVCVCVCVGEDCKAGGGVSFSGTKPLWEEIACNGL